VSRLLTRLDEIERVATAIADQEWRYSPPVLPHGDDCGYVEASLELGDVFVLAARDDEDPVTEEQASNIAMHDPQSVLRLCQAHREIINAYTGALFTQGCHPEDERNNGYVLAMSRAVHELAAGLGLKEDTDDR
jgi:hypothetical protein